MDAGVIEQAKMWDRILVDMAKKDCEPEPELLEFLDRGFNKIGASGLDIGCGLGRHTLAAVKLGFKMTAIDISQTAVDHTKSIASYNNVSVRVQRASMNSLPFKDNEFDFAFSWCVLNHGTKEVFEDAIAEAVRVIRPGGYFFGFVLSSDDPRYGQGKLVEKDCFMFTDGIETGICHYFPSQKDLKSLLSSFTELEEFSEVRYEGEELNFYHPELHSSCHINFLLKKR